MAQCIVEIIPLYLIKGKKPKQGCSLMVKIAIYSTPEDLELLEIFGEKVDYKFEYSKLPKRIEKYLNKEDVRKPICDSCEDISRTKFIEINRGQKNENTCGQRNKKVSK